MEYQKILIIGSGAWGTAIANLIANNQKNNNSCKTEVTILSRDIAIIDEINNRQRNSKYLGDIS